MRKLLYNKKGMYYSLAFLVLYYLVILYITKYSAASSDEAYYYALPKRLLQGDIMFQDAWELHQTSAVILLPFMYLYHIFVPDYTGVILFMRLCYVTVQFLISLSLFQMLRYRFQNLSALLVSFIFLNFTYMLIRAFSYNTMPFLFLTLTLSFIFSNKESKYYNFKLFIAGICFALLVPAYPTFLLMFILIPVIGVVVFLKYRKWIINNKKYILYFVLGMVIAGIVYLCFFLSNSSFQNFFENYEKMKDPYHPYRGRLYPLKIYIKDLIHSLALMHSIPWQIFSLLCIGISFILAFVYRFFHNMKYKEVYVIISLLLLTYVVIMQVYDISVSDLRIQSKMNYYALPCLFMLPTVWMLTYSKKSTIFISTILGAALCYSLIIQYGSTTQLEGSSFPFVLCGIPTIAYLTNFLIKLKLHKYYVYCCCLPIILFSTYYLVTVSRFQLIYNFGDATLMECTTRVETGPMKGLYTTSEKAKIEEGKFDFIKKYLPKEGYALFLDEYPIGYLMTDLDVSPQSVWTSRLNVPVSVLYYDEHFDHLPNFMYVQTDDYYITSDIYKNFEKHNGEKIETEFGIIYVYEK